MNKLIYDGIDAIVNKGTKTTSRAGDIHALYNVFFTLENPRSRHLNLKGRKNNIFAMIAETFWVLAGDDRVDPFLSFFLPRAHEFSDDGVTWRGAYGPRLYQHKQLEDAIAIFEEEGLQTRKSTIAIYLPEKDTKESLQAIYRLEKTKDRPCNNMIHFFVTPDKALHMNVYQRSGDVIWGMGSINVFEWTVLQEFVAAEVARRVDPEVTLGTYNHFVTNVHLYDFTGEQGYDVLKNTARHDFTSENTEPLVFPSGTDRNRQFFTELVALYTRAIGNKEQDYAWFVNALSTIFDDFYGRDVKNTLLFTYTKLLAAYICAKHGNTGITLDLSAHTEEFAACIRDSRFRKFGLIKTSDTTSLPALVEAICALQAEKEKSYGVDWKRFGLVSSLFNIFRKFIRLRTVWESGWQPTSDDTRLDTIIDLLNYLTLGAVLHAEMFPETFAATLPKDSLMKPDDFSADKHGFSHYVRNVLLPASPYRTIEPPALTDTIPQIISLGESTIEMWLFQLAETARVQDGSPAPVHAPTKEAMKMDPSARLEHIRTMIDLCIAAALRHGQEYPEEWRAFITRYAPQPTTIQSAIESGTTHQDHV